MCLALPVEVVERLAGEWAVVDFGGVRKKVSLLLLDEAQPGDFVIVHAGYALALLDTEEARQTLALFAK